MANRSKYTYMAKDDDGNMVFEGRVEFVAEMIGVHPSHLRNLGVDRKRIRYRDMFVTITRKTRK